ncbi:Hypothetical predicted protein [Xyrichtys novacula]|uniref:Uncharacterized protein n=1 Tax=Xyrichtys novacula TaxID=13765 RepID=A0AAV1H0E0_XYRNO|nr:Hypothetical predicted protein [Xyrichtys novacula]
MSAVLCLLQLHVKLCNNTELEFSQFLAPNTQLQLAFMRNKCSCIYSEELIILSLKRRPWPSLAPAYVKLAETFRRAQGPSWGLGNFRTMNREKLANTHTHSFTAKPQCEKLTHRYMLMADNNKLYIVSPVPF